MIFLWTFLALGSVLFGQVFEGIVVNSRTGQPIPGVAVTVEEAGSAAYRASTDPQGAFRIDGIKAGHYAANFTKSKFLPPAVKPQFQVNSERAPTRLRVTLIPLSRVSGRVLDASDQPVHAAELLLDGSRAGLTQTSDEQGNFSFDAVPGNYILSARPPRDLKPPPAEKQDRIGWVKTYYPGVLDERDAVKFAVRAGIDVLEQDIRLRTLPLRRLRGVVLDPRGDPVPRAPVKAAPIGEEAEDDLISIAGDDGKFEFPALYDGEWRVSSELLRGGNHKVRAFTVVQIPGRDVDGVELPLRMPFTVAGSVSISGAAAPQFTRRFAVYLRPLVTGAEGLSEGFPGADGTFTIQNVYPGLYKIFTVLPGPPYFLASIVAGDRDVLGQYVDLHSGAIPIKIAFESSGGSLRGAVEDCGDATVVLMPSSREFQDAQFVQTARCSEGGRFEFPSVRPGDYHAFAFAQWEGPLEFLSALSPSLINKGAATRIRRGETTNVDLRLIAPNP